MKNVVILGSTGSIGTQALEVAQAQPQHLKVVGLAAGSNWQLLAQQIKEWRPEVAVLFDERHFAALRDAVGATSTQLLAGFCVGTVRLACCVF